MHCVFLSFGSNLGDRRKNIEEAYRKIEMRIGKLISKSAFHITLPEGFESEYRFVNSVCSVLTPIEPRDVLLETQRIERELGRTEKSSGSGYADRIIDIDVLMYDDCIVESPDFILPHPRFHTRDFVLAPFAEIAPEVIHPVLKKSIGALKSDLDAKSRVFV